MELIEIEKYIKTIVEDELNFKSFSHPYSLADSIQNEKNKITLPRLINFATLLLGSVIDFVALYLKVRFGRNSFKEKRIVFTDRSLCNVVDGKLVDRVLKPLFTENVIFINHSKEIPLQRINDQKVYNLGILVKFLSIFYRDTARLMRLFRAYTLINNMIIGNLRHSSVYMLLFYNLNGLSLVFSKFRERITLIEVQHGSIINYPPYAKPAPVRIADVFYVKNERTIDYLRSHLCLDFPAEYRIIPYARQERITVPGIHVLYASTVEFNGLHPVFRRFLAGYQRDDLHLIVRLHPREREKEPLFVEQLESYHVDYKFDRSENWLEGNSIANLIVVSPWSSTIEDAFDNGFQSIIIDPAGRERYKHLIDNKRCFYSDDLCRTIAEIFADVRL